MEKTRRERIVELLQESSWSLKALADFLGVKMNIVEDDLGHIEKSTSRTHKFKITPPVCESCGFAFRKRTRFNKPSRCPECRSTRIEDGVFQLVPKNG